MPRHKLFPRLFQVQHFSPRIQIFFNHLVKELPWNARIADIAELFQVYDDLVAVQHCFFNRGNAGSMIAKTERMGFRDLMRNAQCAGEHIMQNEILYRSAADIAKPLPIVVRC